MTLKESKGYLSQGQFNNEEVTRQYEALRREALESSEIRRIIKIIENAGPIMVIDPEKAYEDLDNTLARVKIASENGMKVMELGGSTDENKGAETVIPAIRDVVDKVGGDTLLISFPGTSSQVVKGIDATFSLYLPQLEEVTKTHPHIVEHLNGEYQGIIDRSKKLDVPVFPVTYILLNGGKATSVEEQTKINAIKVHEGLSVEKVMEEIKPWISEEELVMLEMGSSPETSVNLGPLAKEVDKITHVRPIVTGGISSPKLMREVTQHIHSPTVFGTIAENTPPERFEKLYMEFRNAHPSTRGR